MNVNGLLTKRWLSHLESNQNSGYQKPVCSRYTMGQAELWILYHISFAHRPVRMHLMRCGLLMLICITSCGLLRRNGARTPARASASRTPPFGRRGGYHEKWPIRASCGASREPESRRSPAHPSSDRLRGSLRSGDTIPHTCSVSPTFLYGAFSFVVFALADSSSSRLTTCDRSLSVNAVGAFRVAHAPDRFLGIANRSVIHPRIDDQTNQRKAKSQKEYKKDSRLQTHAPRAGKMLGPEILGLLCSIPHEELLAAALACL